MNIISAGDDYVTTSQNVVDYLKTLASTEVGSWDPVNDNFLVEVVAMGSQVEDIFMQDVSAFETTLIQLTPTVQTAFSELTVSPTFQAAWETARAFSVQQEVITKNTVAPIDSSAIAAAQSVRDSLGGGSGGLNSYNSSHGATKTIDISMASASSAIDLIDADFADFADFAQETANLTKFQILQQAGISVLSQANASPQSVLSLLG